MDADSSKPLDGVDPESASAMDVDDELPAALASDLPLVRQRALQICESLVSEDVDAVRPVLDAVAELTGSDNARTALHALSVLQAVARGDPAALENRLDPVVAALSSDIADVQVAGADLFGTVVLVRPTLVAPHLSGLVDAVLATELDAATTDFEPMVADRVTRRTLEEHEQEERHRRRAARKTIVDVVVAVAEQDPAAAAHATDAIGGLLDDDQPAVVGGAADALGEIGAADVPVDESSREALRACLDHEAAFVRTRTVRALGHIGDRDAADAIADLAATDDDEGVRDIAAATADHLTHD
jgi:hypothetical protein